MNLSYHSTTLKSIIEEEINLNSGISLTYNVSLQKFYEKLGFKYIFHVNEPQIFGKDEVILNLNAPSTDTKRKTMAAFIS